MTVSPLQLMGHVDLPPHQGTGGFDHAAVHAASGHVYVAHTANDAVDVFDPASRKHLFSVPDLTAVAGALVSDESQLVFTSNRGENTIGVFAPGADPKVTKIAVGLRPNGLAYDHRRGLVLAANVGDPAVPHSYTLSMVDLEARAMRWSIEVPGRTRWTVFDAEAEAFYVNISSHRRSSCRRAPSTGSPHDAGSGRRRARRLRSRDARLFCAATQACWSRSMPARQGAGPGQASGVPTSLVQPQAPAALCRVGDRCGQRVRHPTMRSIGTVATEKGAHTTAFPPSGDSLIAFLPGTHRAALYG